MNGRRVLKTLLKNAVFLVVQTATAISYEKTVYVDDNGSEDLNDIQAAIEDSNNCDTVAVKDGTCTADENRDINFNGHVLRRDSRTINALYISTCMKRQ